MATNEHQHPAIVRLFDHPEAYDRFIAEHGLNHAKATRAIGLRNPDGSIEVAVDKSYYIWGGIRPDQIPAIVRHEEVELGTEGDSSDAHLAGQIAEYSLVKAQFGDDGLRGYHARLCNLIGGFNDVRNLALSTVLRE